MGPITRQSRLESASPFFTSGSFVFTPGSLFFHLWLPFFHPWFLCFHLWLLCFLFFASNRSEVEVGVPDAAGRAEILRVLLRGVPHAMTGDTATTATGTPSSGPGGGGGGKKRSPSDPREGVADLAARTHGFVGADLQLLVKEAALQALRRTRGTGRIFGDGGGGLGDSGSEVGRGGEDGRRGKRQQEGGGEGEDRRHRSSGNSSHAEARIERREEGKDAAAAAGRGMPTLTPEDFRAALPLVSPSGLREVAVEVPSVKWGDIGGMEGVKQSLREVRVMPSKKPA